MPRGGSRKRGATAVEQENVPPGAVEDEVLSFLLFFVLPPPQWGGVFFSRGLLCALPCTPTPFQQCA